MIQEEALIPYRTSPLPEGPWLVFAPHPDDETFGMGGALALAARKAVKVTLVVLTDGSMGGKEAGSGNIISIREKEVQEISKRLHLESVLFWRQPDRGLRVSQDLINRAAELIRKIKPASVFFPSPMELHPDHRATATLVWEGLRKCPEFRGKAYAYEISGQCPTNQLIDITAVADEKTTLATLYQSQIAERDYLTLILALNRTRSYTLPPEVHFAEAFFVYENIGDTDLALHTLNHLRPYWSEDAVSQEERHRRKNLRMALDPSQNEIAEWRQRCEDLENSRLWRYAEPVRNAATKIKIATQRIREIAGQWKHH